MGCSTIAIILLTLAPFVVINISQVEEGPLENLSEWLQISGRPAQALISIGATRYTDFGETTFLERGDRSIVIVYDGRTIDAEAVRAIARGDAEAPSEGIAVLRQNVI